MKIAFAACMRREAVREQTIWRDVLAAAPDCLLLLGDQIYMDFGILPFSREPNGAPRLYDAVKFRQVMEAKYRAQWDEPNFRRLYDAMHAKDAVLATWDDHDFAWNGARGRAVPAEKREVSRKLFNRWIYGKEADVDVYRYADFPLARIIMLDTRSYATEPGPEGELLGAAQWRFLEQALAHRRPYTVVCSSITLARGFENWSLFPRELARLRGLLDARGRVLFLSGDIHENDFRCHEGEVPLYEITSSGAAVNKLGLPFGLSERRNWGLLELTPETVAVKLHSRAETETHRIETVAWREAR